MKLLGVRASVLSPDINADTGQTLCINICIPMCHEAETTGLQAFYRWQ